MYPCVPWCEPVLVLDIWFDCLILERPKSISFQLPLLLDCITFPG
jgi:hypothetical protein